MQNSFYREIINDHNLRPAHKHELPDANLVLRGVNPSCGDDITLLLKVEDDKITDGAFTGEGCAISQASADIMLDLVIGKSKEEAIRLSDIFLRMIKFFLRKVFPDLKNAIRYPGKSIPGILELLQ